MNVIDARTEQHARVAEEVASVIFGGGTVVFPTDTVYGIGADPFNASAIARIYELKSRPDSKPLSLHVATLTEFLEYARPFKQIAVAARRLLPGPVTIIMPRPAFIDRNVTSGLPTMGFRVPDDPLCCAILDRAGPLAGTSANISGQPAYTGEGRGQYPDADLVVENGPTRYGRESTLIDMTGPEAIVLRAGAVPLERVAELLGPAVQAAPQVKPS